MGNRIEKGPFIYSVIMFWGFSDPPPPLVIKSKHMARPPLEYYVRFGIEVAQKMKLSGYPTKGHSSVKNG